MTGGYEVGTVFYFPSDFDIDGDSVGAGTEVVLLERAHSRDEFVTVRFPAGGITAVPLSALRDANFEDSEGSEGSEGCREAYIEAYERARSVSSDSDSASLFSTPDGQRLECDISAGAFMALLATMDRLNWRDVSSTVSAALVLYDSYTERDLRRFESLSG